VINIVDVSSHNPQPDWNAIRAAGFSVAIVKASEGVNYRDSKTELYCPQARAAGMLVGTYHYLRVRHNAQQDARAQASQYLEIWRQQKCDLRPIVDVESIGNEGRSAAEWSEAVLGWVDQVRAETGMLPCIYTSPGEWQSAGLTSLSQVADCPLWLAQYASSAHPPPPWTQYAMWQYSGSGQIAGAGPYDLSRADSISPMLAASASPKNLLKLTLALTILGAAGWFAIKKFR
jgi:lysozyme